MFLRISVQGTCDIYACAFSTTKLCYYGDIKNKKYARRVVGIQTRTERFKYSTALCCRMKAGSWIAPTIIKKAGWQRAMCGELSVSLLPPHTARRLSTSHLEPTTISEAIVPRYVRPVCKICASRIRKVELRQHPSPPMRTVLHHFHLLCKLQGEH